MIETAFEKKISKQLTSLLKKTEIIDHVDLPDLIDYHDFFSNKLYLIFAIQEGLTYSIFDLIQTNSPFNLNDWSGILNLSYKSLQRYKINQTGFKPIHSEKIFEMAEVLSIGMDVFENLDKFKQWLTTENYALGNLKPIDLLKTSYGKDLVISELTRIDHGIFV